MRVQVGDGRLFFDVEGASLVPDGPRMRERPTLLLLHGGPGLGRLVRFAKAGHGIVTDDRARFMETLRAFILS